MRGTWAGYFYGLASAILMGVASVLVNVARSVPASEVAFARALVGLFLLAPFCYGRLGGLWSRRGVWMWVFGGAGAVSILCFFWNLAHSDVGAANSLFNTTPAFALLLAFFVFRERVARAAALGILLMTAGMTCLLLIGGPHQITMRVTVVGLGGALASAIGFLALSRAIQHNHHQDELPLLALYLLLLLITPIAGSGAWFMPGRLIAAVVFGVGVLSYVGQVLMVKSFAYLPAPIATALVPTALLWAVLSTTAFQSAPTFAQWAAYAAVLGGAILLRVGGPSAHAHRAPVQPGKLASYQ